MYVQYIHEYRTVAETVICICVLERWLNAWGGKGSIASLNPTGEKEIMGYGGVCKMYQRKGLCLPYSNKVEGTS
jgi:hypothetical protein